MPNPPRDPGVTLTNTAIAAMPAGSVLKDDRVKGLEVRKHGAGVSFMLYYRTRAGVQRRPKIGDYPAIGISQAREVAGKLLARVAAGYDPGAEWATERGLPTVGDLWARVKTAHYSRGKSWDAQAAALYEKYIAKPLAAKLVNAVTVDDAAALHQGLKDHPTQANRVIAVLSLMFSYAEKWRTWTHVAIGGNPCQHVTRFPERKRRRFARGEEIARIGPILARYAEDPANLSGCCVLYALMFTGARPTEVLRARPEQMQHLPDGTGTLVLDEHKTAAGGDQRHIHFPAQVMDLLVRLPAKREWLCGRTTLPREIWTAIRKEAGCPDLWARDWRRTFATTALSDGVDIGAVAGIMGHKSIATTKAHYALLTDQAVARAGALTASIIDRKLRSGGSNG